MDGVDQLASGLTQASRDLGDMDAAAAAATKLLEARARSRTPRRSGRLAGSVRAVASGTTPGVTAGGPGLGYVIPVHYGSRYMRGRPFLTDTLTDQTPAVIDIYATGLTSIVNDI